MITYKIRAPNHRLGRNGNSREYWGKIIVYSEPGFLSLAELMLQQASVNVGISDSGYSIARATF